MVQNLYANELAKLEYNKIHACISACILYKPILSFKEQYARHTHCPKCGSLKYKQVGKIKVPMKVVHHFPIIPRLKQM